MKKFFILIVIFVSVILTTFADTNNGSVSSQPIKLETESKPRPINGQHRLPIIIDIQAYYDYGNDTVNILFNGECEGAAYLYLNGTIVDYSTEINTSFLITTCGQYKIEIVTENWISTGYFQL